MTKPTTWPTIGITALLAAERAELHPLTIRCTECDWHTHGLAGETKPAARAHRRQHHPHLPERSTLRWKNPRTETSNPKPAKDPVLGMTLLQDRSLRHDTDAEA